MRVQGGETGQKDVACDYPTPNPLPMAWPSWILPSLVKIGRILGGYGLSSIGYTAKWYPDQSKVPLCRRRILQIVSNQHTYLHDLYPQLPLVVVL